MIPIIAIIYNLSMSVYQYHKACYNITSHHLQNNYVRAACSGLYYTVRHIILIAIDQNSNRHSKLTIVIEKNKCIDPLVVIVSCDHVSMQF